MFTFVSGAEDETYDESKPLEFVHVVTTNAFDVARVFRYRTDALYYAFDFIGLMGAVPALSLPLYREAYINCNVVTMQSSDEKCDIAVTVRRSRIRRERCSAKTREDHDVE